MANRVILVGNVGKDAAVTEVNNAKVAKFSVATTERFKDSKGEIRNKTEWHNIVLWNREKVFPYIKKGQMVYIEGKIQYSSFMDKENVRHNVTDIVASEINLIGRRSDGDQNGEDSLQQKDDDLPF
jgi:single-strand DNA-binding protein